MTAVLHAANGVLRWTGSFGFALGFYWLACTGAGLLIFQCLHGRWKGLPIYHATLLAISFLLGVGVLGQVWTLAALAGVFRLKFMAPPMAALAFAAIWFGRPHFRGVATEIRATRYALRTESIAFSLLLLLVLCWIAFAFTALGRPLSGDGLALHMLLPKVVASSGVLLREYFQPANEFYGILGEMNYALLMQIGSDDAAQMLTYFASIALAVVLIDICAAVGIATRGRIIALTAMFTSTAVLIWIGEGKIDLLATSIGVAGLALIVPRLTESSRGMYFVGGLLLGLAITVKLILGACLAVIAAVFVAFTFMAELADGPARERRLNILFALIGAGLAIGFGIVFGLAPHFIKNGVLIGEPFAPLWSASRADWLVEERWYPPSVVMRIRLLYPIVLTFGDYWAQVGNISVLVLAFLPLALYLPRPRPMWRRPLVAVTVAAWLALAAWATMQGDKVVMRYILPALLLCIPLAAAAGERVTKRSFRPRWLGAAVIGSCFVTLGINAFHGVGIYFFPSTTLKVISQTASPCERGLPWCAPMDKANRLAPPGARVLSISSYRYDLRPDLILCSYNFRTSIFPGRTAEERWRWFYAEGFTFILPDISGNPTYLTSDLDNPPPWVIVKRDQPDSPVGPISVSFDLSKGGPTAPPQTSCREINPGDWRVQAAAD